MFHITTWGSEGGENMSNPLGGTEIGENNFYKIYDYMQGGIIKRPVLKPCFCYLFRNMTFNLLPSLVGPQFLQYKTT